MSERLTDEQVSRIASGLFNYAAFAGGVIQDLAREVQETRAQSKRDKEWIGAVIERLETLATALGAVDGRIVAWGLIDALLTEMRCVAGES